MLEMFVVGFITGLFGFIAMTITEILASGGGTPGSPAIFHGQFQ